MNKTRRKALIRIYAVLKEVKKKLKDIFDEEQEMLDNIPDNLEGSEKYVETEAEIEILYCAFTGLDEVLYYLEEAIA